MPSKQCEINVIVFPSGVIHLQKQLCEILTTPGDNYTRDAVYGWQWHAWVDYRCSRPIRQTSPQRIIKKIITQTHLRVPFSIACTRWSPHVSINLFMLFICCEMQCHVKVEVFNTRMRILHHVPGKLRKYSNAPFRQTRKDPNLPTCEYHPHKIHLPVGFYYGRKIRTVVHTLAYKVLHKRICVRVTIFV